MALDIWGDAYTLSLSLSSHRQPTVSCKPVKITSRNQSVVMINDNLESLLQFPTKVLSSQWMILWQLRVIIVILGFDGSNRVAGGTPRANLGRSFIK